MRRLSTIGYEGKTQEEFLGELGAAGVETVIDVRAIAGKPEFRPVLTPESAGVAMEVSW